ncbi:hypothetical protein ACVIU7_005480 [Bradyrhizobium liaoningense]|nr:hypothetical protein GCM10007858_66150 [Bradyrhizobium liaoningense]
MPTATCFVLLQGHLFSRKGIRSAGRVGATSSKGLATASPRCSAPEERLEILQIKEKYGTLRVYWCGKLSQHSRQGVEWVVALAEARSATTCEQCGEEGRLYRAGAVPMTRCLAHAKGQSVPIKAGLENVHIVQKVVDGRLTVACRRYDRDTDSFIDVGPLSLELSTGDQMPTLRRVWIESKRTCVAGAHLG